MLSYWILNRQIQQMKQEILDKMDALTAAVQAEATVDASAITLIQGLSAQIKAAGTDQATLTALTQQLDAQQKALADAVASATSPVTPPPA